MLIHVSVKGRVVVAPSNMKIFHFYRRADRKHGGDRDRTCFITACGEEAIHVAVGTRIMEARKEIPNVRL